MIGGHVSLAKRAPSLAVSVAQQRAPLELEAAILEVAREIDQRQNAQWGGVATKSISIDVLRLRLTAMSLRLRTYDVAASASGESQWRCP